MDSTNTNKELRNEEQQRAPHVRDEDQAASGVPAAGWAMGDRFSWEEILQRLLASADEEIPRSIRELFFSGVSAGFAIVLTFIGFAVGKHHFPENPFLAAILFPAGFIFIILGRFQLFTENTLPPVILVMTRLASLPLLLRLWGTVLLGNIVGAGVGAFVLANTQVLPAEVAIAATEFVQHGLEVEWWDLFFKSLFAGWVVAGVVWLCAAAHNTMGRLAVIYIGFYLIAVTGLFHVISTTCEIFFYFFLDISSIGLIELFAYFGLPVLLGNTVGGVLLFTFVVYAQAEDQRRPDIRTLTLREVLFSMEGGRPFKTPRPSTEKRSSRKQVED